MPSEDELRRAAEEALARADPELVAGLADLRNMCLALSLPAVRALYRHAAEAAGDPPAAAARAAAALSPVTEVGALQMRWADGGRTRTAYLRMAECEAGHDLDAQLAKIQPALGERWPEVLEHLSRLVGYVRYTFRELAARGRDWATAVDPANTTVYVRADWPKRVGIFVDVD